MMDAASCRLVSRKDPTPGGTVRAISAIVSSAITPGPLGIAETRPRAEAPWRMAIQASLTLRMQQTFTRGRLVASTGEIYHAPPRPLAPGAAPRGSRRLVVAV